MKTVTPMKTTAALLWLIVLFLLLAHVFIAMTTLPEFTVLDQTAFQKHVDKLVTLDANAKETLQMDLIKGRWNGQYGKSLAERTLLIDIVLLLVIVIMMFRFALIKK